MNEDESEVSSVPVATDDGRDCVNLAQGFIQFITKKAETSTDFSLVYVYRYCLLMNAFKLYYDLQKSRDFILIEKIENDFCGVYLLLEKKIL